MTAQPPAPDRQSQLRTLLLVQDASSLAGSLGSLLLGAAWCFGVGIVIASLLWFMLGNWLGWRAWFTIYVVLLVPLLIWLERRSREDYLGNAVGDIDPNPSSRGEYEMNRGRLAVGMSASALVWGPRSMIDGFRGVRGRRTLTQRALFDRAATMIFDLARVDGSVPVKSIMHPPEDMKVFGSAVDWLERHDWIGKATNGDSFWLSSIGRKKLVEHNLNPAQTRG
ncbi:MAG TPA: hypothetical protein VLJ39_22890 [Tepidisphaeraceae bacterium]|nr:hypothetical protein [Tepidisphaeraceae bacterium]